MGVNHGCKKGNRRQERYAEKCLQPGFAQGGIPIQATYPEPVAALYAVAAVNPRDGVCSILDWGGGTLDIACLRINDRKAYVLSTEGLKEGGDDFDKWIAMEALNHFLSTNPSLQTDRDLIWKTKHKGLLLRAENLKWEYADNPTLRWNGFVGKYDLEFQLDAEVFKERLRNPVDRAIRLFYQAVKHSGEPDRLVRPVILSGGTRNLDFIRQTLEAEFGDRIIDELPQTGWFRDVGKNRIDSATALGAALLMASESLPVFSSSLGIRMAESRDAADTDFSGPSFIAEKLLTQVNLWRRNSSSPIRLVAWQVP
jgi:molecular chaperone DnaK